MSTRASRRRRVLDDPESRIEKLKSLANLRARVEPSEVHEEQHVEPVDGSSKEQDIASAELKNTTYDHEDIPSNVHQPNEVWPDSDKPISSKSDNFESTETANESSSLPEELTSNKEEITVVTNTTGWLTRLSSKCRPLTFALLACLVYLISVKGYTATLSRLTGQPLDEQQRDSLIGLSFVIVELQLLWSGAMKRAERTAATGGTAVSLMLRVCGVPAVLMDAGRKMCFVVSEFAGDLAVYLFVLLLLRSVDGYCF